MVILFGTSIDARSVSHESVLPSSGPVSPRPCRSGQEGRGMTCSSPPVSWPQSKTDLGSLASALEKAIRRKFDPTDGIKLKYVVLNLLQDGIRSSHPFPFVDGECTR